MFSQKQTTHIASDVILQPTPEVSVWHFLKSSI